MEIVFTIICMPTAITVVLMQLFNEVVLETDHEKVKNVWLTAGHVFVGLEDRQTLYTFDAKCADYIQTSDNEGCLDLKSKSPIVTIIAQSTNKVFIVFQDGHVTRWIYKPDKSWKLVTEFTICSVSMATITAACLNVYHDTLYYCQKEQTADGDGSILIVYKRQVKEGEDSKNMSVTVGPAFSIILNCPDCMLYPLGHGIILATSVSEAQAVSLCVILCTLTSKVEVVAGNQRVTIADLSLFSAIEFKQIVLRCVKIFLQKSSKVIRTCFNYRSQRLYQLCEDGRLFSITRAIEHEDPVKTVTLQDFTSVSLLTMIIVTGNIGLVYETEIRLYSLLTGKFVCALGIPEDQGMIQGACQSILGGYQAGIFTGQDIYLIQKSLPSSPPDQFLMECSNFQTDAMRLSYINKVHRYTSAGPATMSLDTLREAWFDGQQTPPTTKLVETVEPYLTEYWKLENMLQKCLSHPKESQVVSLPSVASEVGCILDPRSPKSRSVRQSQLVYLANSFPEEVLDTLLSRLNSRDGGAEVSAAQQHLWQCVLAPETSELPGSSDIATPLFELMCYLLYKHRPDRMLKFLQRAQKVWDHKVGMSAFVRHRQNLMVYERALKCLPEPETFADKPTAIQAHVHILLISETDGCFLKAVRLLVKYGCWEECVDLLTEYRDKCKQYALLYQLVLSALTKNHKLHLYAEKVFSLMPKFISCDDMHKGDNSDCPTDVFAKSEDSVTVDCVRPHLLKSLSKAAADY